MRSPPRRSGLAVLALLILVTLAALANPVVAVGPTITLGDQTENATTTHAFTFTVSGMPAGNHTIDDVRLDYGNRSLLSAVSGSQVVVAVSGQNGTFSTQGSEAYFPGGYLYKQVALPYNSGLVVSNGDQVTVSIGTVSNPASPDTYSASITLFDGLGLTLDSATASYTVQSAPVPTISSFSVEQAPTGDYAQGTMDVSFESDVELNLSSLVYHVVGPGTVSMSGSPNEYNNSGTYEYHAYLVPEVDGEYTVSLDEAASLLGENITGTPSDSFVADTGPPSITDFDASVDGDEITLSVDADEALLGLSASVDGPSSTTLSGTGEAGDFLEVKSGGTYSYTATWTAPDDGSYDLTLDSAYDAMEQQFTGSHATTVEVATNTPKLAAPGTLSFGTTLVGTTATRTVTIANEGTAPFGVTNVSLAGEWFVLDGPASFALGIGESRDLTVAFDPAAATDETGTLTYETNISGGSSHSISLSGAGERRDLSLSGDGAFGTVRVGESATRTLTVEAGGTIATTVSGLAASGPGFSVEGDEFTVGAGESATVTVTFAPDSPGAANGTLSFDTNVPGDEGRTVSLSGTGVAPEATVAPTSHDFEAVRVGANATTTIEVGNAGGASLGVDGVAVVGANASAFAASAGAASVPAGGSTPVTVTYAPTTAGEHAATLEIRTDDASNGTLSVPLAGAGVASRASISATSLTFDDTAVGGATTRNVTLSNTGGAPLHVTAATVVGANASAFDASVVASTVPAGDATRVRVRFSPTAASAQAATLRLETDDPSAGPITVSLAGSGLAPALTVEPLSVDFGVVTAGSNATARVTLRNAGGAPLNVTGVRLANGGPFALVSGWNGTLRAGAARTLVVRAVPAVGGDHESTLLVESDDPRLPTASIPLSARASAPEVSVSTSAINYGEVGLNETVTRSLTVTNDGNATLDVARVAVVGADRRAFDANASGFSLAPGASRSLDVTFEPTGTDPASATLRLATNDPSTPQADVWLSNTDTVVRVAGAGDENRSTVRVSVANATGGSTVSVNVSQRSTRDANVAVDAINLSVERGGDFAVNLTASDDPPTDASPTFEREDNTSVAKYVRVDHTIRDENISNVSFRVRLKKSTLAPDDDPADVAMYRFENGTTWRELPTTLVGESATHYLYEVRSPGLSEFAAGIKQPKFEVSEASVTVSQVFVGDLVKIPVLISNDGGADGTYEVSLLVDDAVDETRTVSVASKGSLQLTFERTFDAAATYGVRVNDVSAGSVEVQPEPTTTDPGDETTTGSGSAAGTTTAGETGATTDASGTTGAPATGTGTSESGGAPGFGAGVALLALAGVGVLARRSA